MLTSCVFYTVYIILDAVEVRCCLHIGADTKENSIQFSDKTIQTCRAKKEIRDQCKKKKSKFDDIELPEVIDDTTGYHPSCFRNFCSPSEN